MRHLMYLNMGILAAVFVFFSGCDLFNSDHTPEVPEPVIVSAQDLPNNMYTSEGVYYLIRHDSTMKKWEKGAGFILEELLNNNFHPKHAWFPLGITPCMVATAHDGFIVELKKPNKRILEHDFISNIDYLVLNCGIKEFQYYSFE